MTTFTDDDEARSMWINEGVDPEHIQKMGMEDNFWTTGGPGPGGPAPKSTWTAAPPSARKAARLPTRTATSRSGTSCSRTTRSTTSSPRPTCTSWASLRTRTSIPVPAWNVWAYLLQGKNNIYETDEVFPVIEAAEQLSGLKYGENEDATCASAWSLTTCAPPDDHVRRRAPVQRGPWLRAAPPATPHRALHAHARRDRSGAAHPLPDLQGRHGGQLPGAQRHLP